MNLINAIADKIRHSFNHEWEMSKHDIWNGDDPDAKRPMKVITKYFCRKCGESKQISIK